MGENVEDILNKNFGIWHTPKEIATKGNLNIIAVYAALKKLNVRDPCKYMKKKEGKRVYYMAGMSVVQEKTPEGEGTL